MKHYVKRLQDKLQATIDHWELRREQGGQARITCRLFKYLQVGDYTAESAYDLLNILRRGDPTKVSKDAINDFFDLISYCWLDGTEIVFKRKINESDDVLIAVVDVGGQLAIRIRRVNNKSQRVISSEVIRMNGAHTLLPQVINLYSDGLMDQQYLQTTIIKSLLILFNLCLNQSLTKC